MIPFLFIVVCLAAGFGIRSSNRIPPGSYRSINAWILYIALPACFLRYIPDITWDRTAILPLTSPVVVWVGARIMISLYHRRYKIGQGSRGALTLTAGLSNTAFLGFIAVYYSEKDIGIAILYDQVSFILLSTAGFLTALREAGGTTIAVSQMAKKLLTFPPFLACLLALCLPASAGLSKLNPMLNKIAATVGPMALYSIGLQFDFTGLRQRWRHLFAGLSYKLFIAPLLILLIVHFTGQQGDIARISVFQAAMPTLASAAVLADEYHLDPPLANGMTGLSILLSLFTLAGWWLLLRYSI